MRTKIVSRKNNFKNWLLYIALFLNVFAFSGYAVSSGSGIKHQPETKIEWVFAIQATAKRAVSYNSASLFSVQNKTVIFGGTDFRKALFIFNNLVKTKTALITKQTFSFSLPVKFFCFKAFSPRLAEELPSSLLG